MYIYIYIYVLAPLPAPYLGRFVTDSHRRHQAQRLLSTTSPSTSSAEAPDLLEGVVGDAEVLRETERVRRLETAEDVVVARNVTLVKTAEHGEDRMVTLLSRVSFGVKAGTTGAASFACSVCVCARFAAPDSHLEGPRAERG